MMQKQQQQQKSNAPRLRREQNRSSPAATLSLLRGRLTCPVWVLLLIYLSFLYTFFSVMEKHPSNPQGEIKNEPAAAAAAPMLRTSASVLVERAGGQKADQPRQRPSSYADWRKLAVELAQLPPSEILTRLEQEDPFGVRALEKMMAQVSPEELFEDLLPRITQIFPCPSTTERLGFPDQRNLTKAQAFRDNAPGVFIFFQHLRKAGGTNVCTLATANLPKKNLPSYFCMPDYYWLRDKDNQKKGHNNGCAGCLHRWSNDEIVSKMGPHRIAGNEWDSFDPTRHLDLPAVFVTSFRRPLDRAVSQFRFECLEHRGCKFTQIEPWWEHRHDLYNVYTWTFSDVGRQGQLATSTEMKDIQRRSEAVGTALDVMVQFHVIMIMEYLRFAAPLVQDVLGFSDTTVLTQHVRPHNGQLKRQDSLIPKDYLSAEQYRRMSETLALDEILTDAAQRLFWERLVCNTH